MGARRAIGIASATVALVASNSAATAAGPPVRPLNSPSSPTTAPFPSDRWTVSDHAQRTGLRVALPLPADCVAQLDDCDDLRVLNTLDGFSAEPRVSIPFDGDIDPASVTRDTVFLQRVGKPVRKVGLDRLVWDPPTRTLHGWAQEQLEQDTRYELVVTRDVRDRDGDRIGPARGPHGGGGVAISTVFTTQSVTATAEKMASQIRVRSRAGAGRLRDPARRRPCGLRPRRRAVARAQPTDERVLAAGGRDDSRPRRPARDSRRRRPHRLRPLLDAAVPRHARRLHPIGSDRHRPAGGAGRRGRLSDAGAPRRHAACRRLAGGDPRPRRDRKQGQRRRHARVRRPPRRPGDRHGGDQPDRPRLGPVEHVDGPHHRRRRDHVPGRRPRDRPGRQRDNRATRGRRGESAAEADRQPRQPGPTPGRHAAADARHRASASTSTATARATSTRAGSPTSATRSAAATGCRSSWSSLRSRPWH